MKGFYIELSNGLLDPKHYKQMGDSVWLFMWLLDRVTSVNENGIGKVLNNSVITHELVFEDLPILRRTYLRQIERLRKHGYIKTIKARHGLYITVKNTKKSFGKKVQSSGAKIGTSQNPVVPKLSRRHAKIGNSEHFRHAKIGTSLYIEDKDSINYKDINISTTNVVDTAKPRFGDPKINDLFDYWEQQTEMPIRHKIKANRKDASILLNMYGEDKLKQLIYGVALAMNDQYAPNISDFTQLKNKVNDLLVWGRKRSLQNGTKAVDLT